MSKKEEVVRDKDGNNVRVITKKKGGCGTFFTGFFCCLLFFVIVFGGTGAYLWFGMNLAQIEKILGTELPIDGDIRNKSFGELISLALETKDNYVHMKISEVESKLGIDLPQKIPGTDISITYLYDASVQFNNATVVVKDIELMDAVNNLDAFVDAILPVFYDNTTVGEILTTLDMQTTIQEMGYPALVDAIYNVGTLEQPVYKDLSSLTISQAQDVLVEYYGSDNLTIQNVVDALGLQEFIPDPVTGETDVYAGIRGLLLTSVSIDDILDNLDGKFLTQVVDLSDFAFTQTAEFGATKLSSMVDYIQTVPLSQIIDVPTSITSSSTTSDKLLYAVRNMDIDMLLGDDPMTAILNLIDSAEGYPNLTINDLVDMSEMNISALGDIKVTDLIRDADTTINAKLDSMMLGDLVTLSGIVDENFFVNNPEFASLEDTPISQFAQSVKGLKINQILTASQLANTSLSTAQQEMTIPQLLQSNAGMSISQLLGTDNINAVGGYLSVLATATASDFDTRFDALSIQDIVGASNQLSQLYRLADMSLGEIFDDPNALNTIIAEFGTIGELCGSNEGIFAIIGDISIQELLDNPNAISNAINSSTVTLAQFLDFTPDNAMITLISNIQVGQLFTDAESAIMQALCGDSNQNTLATLLGIDNPTGLTKVIAGINVNQLLNGDAGTAFQNALKGATDVTLGSLLNNDDSNQLITLISDLTVADLFGTNPGQKIYDKLATSDTTLLQFIGKGSASGLASDVLGQLTLSDLFGTGDISTEITSVVNSIKLTSIFDTSTMDKDTVLYKLLTKESNQNLTVGGLQDAITNMTLADVVGTPTSGVLALEGVDLSVSINNIGDAFSNVNFATIDIADFIRAGLLSCPEGTQVTDWEGITLQTVIDAYSP